MRPFLVWDRSIQPDLLRQRLSKQGICPRKPRAGEFRRVVHVEAFVHEIGACVRAGDHLKAVLLFGRVNACQNLHAERDMPDVPGRGVRVADAFCSKIFGISFMVPPLGLAVDCAVAPLQPQDDPCGQADCGFPGGVQGSGVDADFVGAF